MRAFFVFLAAMAFGFPALAETSDYEAGQVWAYKTAANDEGSLVMIREVDQIGPEEDPMIVYHISMIGVRLPGQSEPIEVQHLPVSRETLDASVTDRVTRDAAFRDYVEGKAMWEEANGGVFTITLREIADIVREQLAPQIRHHGGL